MLTDTVSGGGKSKDNGGSMTRTREGSQNQRKSAFNALKRGQPVGVVAGKSSSE